jgi:hypothetical protein
MNAAVEAEGVTKRLAAFLVISLNLYRNATA